MNPPSPVLLDLKQRLAKKEYAKLKPILLGAVSSDLISGWESFSPFERIVLFKLLPIDRAESFFDELDLPAQAQLLSTLERGALGPVLDEAPSSLFHSLPPSTVDRMILRVTRCR